MAASDGQVLELRATLFRCRQCPKVFCNRTNALYHSATHGQQDVIPNALLRELRGDGSPRPGATVLHTTVHVCSNCSRCSPNRSTIVVHALRCGGDVVARPKARFALSNGDGPPAAHPRPVQPARSVPANGATPPLARDDPIFAEIVGELETDGSAAEWMTLLDDDDSDDFDWVRVSAQVAWRLLRAKSNGRLVEWTASDGRRLSTRLSDFKRQLLATCAAACLAAAQEGGFACPGLQRRASVFEHYMSAPVDDWGVSRLVAVMTWGRVVGEAMHRALAATNERTLNLSQLPFTQPSCSQLMLQCSQPRASQTDPQQAPQAPQQLPAGARRWLTTSCIPRLCTS